MAAENNSNKIQEKGILYDLDIPYEWPETVKILVRIFRVFLILVGLLFCIFHVPLLSHRMTMTTSHCIRY